MVKVQPNEQHNYYLDGYLKSNLDHVQKEVRKQDFDSFIIIAGREGFGKSTLAGQVAMYLDPTYCLERCTFTASQFEEACLSAEKCQAVVFDETMGYLSSRGAMSKFNRQLIKIMSEMRSKNLFVILCIPNFFELDKYPAIHRSTGLLNIYKRGNFQSYDYKKKKYLYLQGKKFYETTMSGNFHGPFVKYFVLDKKAYEEKKQKSIAEWDKVNEKEKKFETQRDILVTYLCGEKLIQKKEIADLIGVSKSYISFILRKEIKLENLPTTEV